VAGTSDVIDDGGDDKNNRKRKGAKRRTVWATGDAVKIMLVTRQCRKE
jgi:hypothetical protein